MAEENSDLPIEELGIDLVVNAGDTFISDMSKAGRQMTTFTTQIGNLAKALPELNGAFVALKTNLADINNRTGNVKNLAQALNQLGKMPNTVKNVATNATSAAQAVDKLYTSLEKAQARMAGLRSEEAKMRLEMQRKQGATSGTTSTGAVTGKGTASTKRDATAEELKQLRRQALNAAANANGKVMQLARRITDDPRNQELAVKLGVEIDEGKISAETEQALQAAIKTAANEAQGPDRRYFEKLGKYVGGGLADGIAASEEAVIKGGTDMAEHLLAAIANTLQTHSPSKVTTQRGKDVGEGLAQGVKSAIPVVEAAGKAMGDALLGAIDESLGQVGQRAADKVTEAVGGKGKVPAWATKRVERAQTAAQRKQDAMARQRSQQVIDQNLEGANYLMSLPDDKRQALKEASRLRVTRKLTSNRGQNVLYQGAVEDSLIGQMKAAGAYGTAPGTESLGNTKMQGAFVPSLGRVMRWKTRRGGGASQGHNAGQRDFTGALYQQMMGAYADQGGLENTLATAKPDSSEWKALAKYYSPVTAAFPWQPQPARVPRGFKGKEEDLQAAAEAAGKYVIKAMGLEDQPDTIKHKRLGSKAGTAAFNKFFDEMPEMAPFREVNNRDAKQYLRENLRVGIDKQRVVAKQGDPQIEQITSDYYETAHQLIGRQDATLDEIIDGLSKVNDQIRKDLRAKFEATQNPVFKMLSERDDPVMRRTIDYLKKFGDQPSKENSGQTMREVIDAWANVWKFLKKKFGGQEEAMAALSEYEHYVSQIETPAARNDLMPNFPRGLEVRRTRGRPRQVDRTLAAKRRQETADAERAYAESQQIQRSRIQMAVDFGDVQGSRKLITQFEKQKMQAQVPDAAAMGVDREKVLEASNSAISIEWELKAQEDAINQAAEAYAKKNGRTLEQVNQAVENVRTGKNKKPGRALTDLAKMIAEYDKAITRWEAAIDAYLEKALPARQAASKSIGKGIAKGELRTASAKYLDADGKQVNPEGMNVRTRNLTFIPGGLVRGADDRPEVFDTSRTQRQYQPEMLGATAEAAYAPAYKKPRGYIAPELTDKERLKRASRAAEIQAELGGQWHKGLEQKYGGFKPPTKKAFAGGDLEKAARTFGEYSRDFNELLRIKTTELGTDVKTALDSINTAANNYIGSAVKYIDSFKASGFLEKGAAEQFNASLIKAQAEIINLKNRSAAGEEIDPATVKTVVKALHERIKTMGMFMEQSTAGLDELEKAADKVVADTAAAAEDEALRERFSGVSASAKAARDEAAMGDRFAGRATAGATQQAAHAAGAAAAGAAAAKQATAGAFTFPDDWVIRLVNAIGQAADKVVAAVRGIRIELVGGGVAENVGPTGAQKQAGRPKQTEAESVRGLANVQADLIRTSEVDAYRASHTAMRQVRQANDLNPTEVGQLQEAIEAWRAAAIKDATDSIKQQADRGDVVDAFRASRSQADLDLQKIVGPEIRKAIQNQEKAVSEREMRTLKTAFDDIARKEREVTTALQKSGAPAQQLEADLKAVAAAAELARYDVIDLSQSAGSFQILDAQVDQVVNSFKEMGEQAKFAAAQADRTPLMKRELAVNTRVDSITRAGERAKTVAGSIQDPTERQNLLAKLDAEIAKSTGELNDLYAEAVKGGIGAEASTEAFNLQLQKIRANASGNIEALREQARAALAADKAAAAASAKTPKVSGGVSDVDRALGAGQRSFAKAATLGKRVLDEPYANQKVVTDLLKQLANVKAKTQEAIDKALADPLNATGSEKANAVREAIQSTKADLDGIVAKLRDIERASQGVTGSFQKIDHAVADVRSKIADLGAGGRARIDSTFASSLAIDLDKTANSAVKKFEPTITNLKTRLTQMYTEARQAALAGDKAAVNQLTWEIRKLTDVAEAQVDASLNRILARADQIDRQVKGMQQIKDWAKDPQSFLQEQTVGKAKQGGLTGWINRAKLNFQEADATAEMFKNAQKAKVEMNNLDVILRTLKNTVGGVFYGISGVFKLLSSPVWLPLKAGIAIFKGLSLAIDGVAGSFKKLRYMVALPGMKKNFAAGLNKDERGQQYAETYAQYTALFEKMNRTQYSKATAGKKFFAMPGFDKASIDRQAKDFGALQSAYEKLQKAAVKQGIMDKPVSAVGKAAAIATKPVTVLVDTITLGASASAREQKALNAEMARTGTTAQAAGQKVVRSGLFGAKRVTTQPRTATGQFDAYGVPQTVEPAKKKFNKLFADIGTGAGMGMGMSLSWGIINAVQNMGMRIQQTISGIVSNGFAAVMETEMRKMTMRSFITNELADVTKEDKRTPNYGEMWEEAGKQAEDYYKQVVEIAKLSSYSRKPLLDLFQNMQVGGLTADNAAAVTRAVTMFGDAFMPGQKQMMDTFGQQVMQMMSQGVMQQVDLKLLAQQGIPVYKFLAENLEGLAGKSKQDAQSEIFDMISKGELGAVQGLEAITKGMVNAAENFKGKAATTFSGLISTFQDLMLEKSETLMVPVAENLFKPIVEFANVFLQSDAVTKGINEFGKQVNSVAGHALGALSTALGVIYGLWSNLPDPIKQVVVALGEAVAIMGTLSLAIGVLAVVGAWLAPIFGAISGTVVAATAAIGAFVTAYTNNLFGFQTFLNTFAQNTITFFLTWGQRLAQGILDGVGQAASAMAGVINNFGANFMANMEAIYAGIYNFGQNAGAAIGAGLTQIQTWVGTAIDWLWALPTNIDEIVGWLGQAWNDMIATMTSWGQAVITIIQETLTGLWEFPKGLDEIGAAVWDWGANIVQIFAGGMQSAINVVGEALQAIGDMFSDWLEPHSPPKLLPDLDKWGTAAADIYLEGWTKADFGVMNDLSSKLEEALALDEGTLKEPETEAIRRGVADMVSKATQGIADSGQIMVAIPGWGGRAEQVKRLSDAYATLAVSQHKLTVEQEKLDAITARYDAILKPLEARLNSIRNKQEALDLTDQIREYQNVLDNVYATDKQKAAAKLKMDELKLTQQINDTEMARDALTDPINERISALTAENSINQDNLDLAIERWNVETAMLKASQGKGGAAGGAADGAADAAATGSEKNRQFTQPTLSVPKFDAKKSLGSIGSKMATIAESMKKYFGKMQENVQPLLDALQGIADKTKIVTDAIDAGFVSRTYSTEGGFIGFLNNVGVAIGTVIDQINAALAAYQAFTGALGAAWQFGDPNAGVMPGPQEQGMFGDPTRPLSLSDLQPTTGGETNEKGFGGWGSASGKKPQIIGGGYITKQAQQWNEQANIVQRVAQIKTLVETDLTTTLAAAGTAISTFATTISTTVSTIDWVTIGANFKTGLDGIGKNITDFVASIPSKIVEALGIELTPGENNISANQLAGATAQKSAEAGKAAGSWASAAANTILNAIGAALETVPVDSTTVAGLAAGAVVLGTNTVIAILGAISEAKLNTDAFYEIAKAAGETIAALVIGTLFGAVMEAFNGEKVLGIVDETKKNATEMMSNLLVDLFLGIGIGLAQPLIDAYNQAAEFIKNATGGLVDRTISPEQQAKTEEKFTTGVKGALGIDKNLTAPLTAFVQPGLGGGPAGYVGALGEQAYGLGKMAFGAPDQKPQFGPELPATSMAAAGKEAADGYANAFTANIGTSFINGKAGETAWGTLSTQFSAAATAKAAADPNIKTVGDAIGAGVIAGIGGHFGAAGDALNTASGALLQKFAEVWGIQSPSTVSRDKIGVPIGQGIVEGIQSILGGGMSPEGGASSGPQSLFDALFASIGASMTAFGLAMQVSWLNLKTAITGTLTTLSLEWLTIFDTFYEDANTKFDEWTVNWIEERVPAFGEALIELAGQFKDGFLTVMDELIEGLNEKLSAMLAAVSNEEIVTAFYDAGYNLGGSLVGGIIEAMTNDEATSRFDGMADQVIGTILQLLKDAAGVNSPSKVMRDEVGSSLAEGIALGMVYPKAQKMLSDSSGNVIEQIVKNFQGNNAAQTVTTHTLRQPEQNMVSQAGATRNYTINMSVTPEMATNVNYNFALLEAMAG